MFRLKFTNLWLLLLLLFPFSGWASYGTPNGPMINARIMGKMLAIEQKPVTASNILSVVEQHQQTSWNSEQWEARSHRFIVLKEISRWIPGAILMLVIIAIVAKKLRRWFLPASLIVLLAIFVGSAIFDWLPPYKSYSYLADFVPAPHATFPGDPKAILLYEKLDLRPKDQGKAVIFCDGAVQQLSVEQINSILEAQRKDGGARN